MSVNCWPSPLVDGTTDVNIEYETEFSTAILDDVIITIPFPEYNSSSPCVLMYRSGSIPDVREVDGDYQITAAGFEWRPSISEVENGRLEFNVDGDDVEGFYPVEVRYKTATPVCAIDVSPLSYSAN
jgi:coatomer subunit delta